MERAKGVENEQPLIQNVACSDDVTGDADVTGDGDGDVTDNIFFENGKFDSRGRFSGFGTLYIFDILVPMLYQGILKGEYITLPLTSCLTGLESAV